MRPRLDWHRGAEKSHTSRPTARRPRWLGVVVVVLLTLLAIAQSMAPGPIRERLLPLAPDADFVAVGDDLSGVQMMLADDGRSSLGDGRAALLLVFDPDCVHSASVAPGWFAWLSGAHPQGSRVLAVSRGPLLAAQHYAHEHRWPVLIGSLGAEDRPKGPGAHRLAKRTPWVFAISPEGRVMGEGHGGKVAEVARTLLSHAEDSPEQGLSQVRASACVGLAHATRVPYVDDG